MLEEGAFAFVETDSHGVVFLVGVREAALDSALPILVVVLDWKPELHVVVDAHGDVKGAWLPVLGSWR